MENSLIVISFSKTTSLVVSHKLLGKEKIYISIDVHYHIRREVLEEGDVNLKCLRFPKMLAKIVTKPVGFQKLKAKKDLIWIAQAETGDGM